MNVDETKDRVYIHDLEAEIADMEQDEEKLVFIPDIEKRMMKIPKSVLLGKHGDNTSNEVVLYGVPESLTIPEEQDNVRKAILEARARAREKQIHGEQTANDHGSPRQMNGVKAQGWSQTPSVLSPRNIDEDAMDMG
jgi:hypothetical protein